MVIRPRLWWPPPQRIKGIGGGSGLMAVVSCFQGRWAEELASATEAGTSVAAWRVDARTWHGFSEEFGDIAPPIRDRVPLLGFVILECFRFVLANRRWSTPRHGLCIAAVRAAAFFSFADWVDGDIWSDSHQFAEEILQQASRQGFASHDTAIPLRTVENEVQTSLRRLLR